MFLTILLIINAVLYAGLFYLTGRRLLSYQRYIRQLKESAEGPIRNLQELAEGSIYIPDPVKAVLDAFTELGYQRITEYESKNLDGKPDRIWVIADSAATTHATIVLQSYGVHVSLNTVYDDGIWIQTLSQHPPNTYVDRLAYPKLRRETAKTSDPAGLVNEHQALLSTVVGGERTQQKIETSDDYRERLALWRSEHYPFELALILKSWRKQQLRILTRLILPTLVLIFLTLIILDVISILNPFWFAIFVGLMLLLFIPGFIRGVVNDHHQRWWL